MAKRNEIAKALLVGIATIGILTIAIITPGVLPAIAGALKLNKKYSPRQIKQSLQKLEKSELISVTEELGKTVVKLTKQGQQKILRFKLEEMKIRPQKYWDKKWRLVIFDVPKNLHINRTIFAKKLREIGFKPLQKSVWITPYPCEDEIDFLKEIYLIKPYVRVVMAQSIDIQNDLIDKFRLG